MHANRRPGLTRDIIIESGLRLLDEVGLEGLTVRRLAADLGVRSPALYWHFRTKQELLDGMADAMVQGAGMGPPRTGESWREWLERRARAYYESLLAHRDGALVVVQARQLSPATMVRFNQEIAGLVEQGFTPVLALHTITAISHYVTGWALQVQGASPAGQVEQPPHDHLEAVVQLLGSDAPLLEAFRAEGGAWAESSFNHGLRVLLDGTAAALSRLAD
ncbi:TetR/AcrR family transcriptional regulator C-terminal domain-containing protein [Nonomuraea sp. NPDC048881]|uniref:TetR/AcrR family transcriptional regulator C-terminal domain-containing protein n=1 Tax=Nonomuraea sp. NPDC048881 TaxID=3155030 RepID=UPI0033E343E8